MMKRDGVKESTSGEFRVRPVTARQRLRDLIATLGYILEVGAYGTPRCLNTPVFTDADLPRLRLLLDEAVKQEHNRSKSTTQQFTLSAFRARVNRDYCLQVSNSSPDV